MAGKISMRARGEVVLAVSERYQAAGRIEKRRILDELCTATGWHRKHAIRALSPRDRSASRHLRPRRRTYGTSIRDALIALWEASGRLCGKHDSDAAAGAGTTWPTEPGHVRTRACFEGERADHDRLLTDVKIAAAGGRRRRAGFSSAVRRQVPVRTFND